MGLSIKNAKTVSKIRRLAMLRGKGFTEAVDDAVSRELRRLQLIATTRRAVTMAAIRRIQRDYAAGRPVATGSAEDVIGYNNRGHFD